MYHEHAGKSRAQLESIKASRKREGKPIGRLNRSINTLRSTSELRSKISERNAAGKPTRHLIKELARRKH